MFGAGRPFGSGQLWIRRVVPVVPGEASSRLTWGKRRDAPPGEEKPLPAIQRTVDRDAPPSARGVWGTAAAAVPAVPVEDTRTLRRGATIRGTGVTGRPREAPLVPGTAPQGERHVPSGAAAPAGIPAAPANSGEAVAAVGAGGEGAADSAAGAEGGHGRDPFAPTIPSLLPWMAAICTRFPVCAVSLSNIG